MCYYCGALRSPRLFGGGGRGREGDGEKFVSVFNDRGPDFKRVSFCSSVKVCSVKGDKKKREHRSPFLRLTDSVGPCV